MTLDHATRDKLGKLIPRLGSNHDGEVVATVAAIRRVLAASGCDLHDIVQALDKPPQIVFRDPRPSPTDCGPYEFSDVIATCERLLDPDRCEINEVERKFVVDMQRLARKYRSRFRMTGKQALWLRRLADDHSGLEVKA